MSNIIRAEENLPQMTTRLARINELSQTAADQLPADKKKIVAAALAPKIEERPTQDVQAELITAITAAYTICGQKADSAALVVNAVELYARLMEVYPKITTEEVRSAIRAGVYDEYGEYYGLNVRSLMYFVRSYLASKARASAIEEWQQKRLILNQDALDPEAIRRGSAVYTNELYRSFCLGTLVFNQVPAFIYDFMVREGLVMPPLDLTRAASYYNTQIEKDRTRFISSLYQAGQAGDRTAAVQHIARQYGICDYFTRCKGWFRTMIFFKKVFIIG